MGITLSESIALILVIGGLLSPSWSAAEDFALDDIERAVELALPSVVKVTAKENTPLPNDPITHYGAGVILDSRGFILICEHLITNANSIAITLSDDREFPATLVAAEKSRDLALIKVTSDVNLPAIAIGRSSKLKLGSRLVAIGNPMGEGMSVTEGILSTRIKKLPATGIVSYENVLQTDAAINPGNSGGVLINRAGEMVGFVVAMRANAQNMGYAVEVETIRSQLADLLRSIYATDNKLGLSARAAKDGVTISNVSAENAANGILPGDRIRRVGLKTVNDDADFELQLLERPAGDMLRLEIDRTGLGSPLTIDVPIK